MASRLLYFKKPTASLLGIQKYLFGSDMASRLPSHTSFLISTIHKPQRYIWLIKISSSTWNLAPNNLNKCGEKDNKMGQILFLVNWKWTHF